MKARLCILYVLQFGIWGCYLTSLGQFLGAGGLGADIAWFYAAIGLVSLITPSVFGHIADRYVPPVRLLGLCHLLGAAAMLVAFGYSIAHPKLDFAVFYPLYLLFLAFYMPTMALSNTAAFAMLRSRGLKPVDAFPSIRVWGTVGFILAMWWVNSTYWHDGALGWTTSDTHPCAMLRFQYNSGQLCCAGILGIIAALYTLVLPSMPSAEGKMAEHGTGSHVFRLNSLRQIFKIPAARYLLIFAAFVGVCMQISNGFATPYISHFIGVKEFSGDFVASNATMLFSISQISEALMILCVGYAMNRAGFRLVYFIGIIAWALRFFFLGIGNPGDGLLWLVLSMIIYGVAFNFITIAGHLYMEQLSPAGHKGLGQGALMLMSNGIGATLGTLCAGGIINRWCSWQMVDVAPGKTVRLFMGDWVWPWLIFSAYALIIGVGWMVFRRFSAPTNLTKH